MLRLMNVLVTSISSLNLLIGKILIWKDARIDWKNEEYNVLHMSENNMRNHFLNIDLIRMQMMKSKDRSNIGQ